MRFDLAIRDAGYIPMSGQIITVMRASSRLPKQTNTDAEKNHAQETRATARAKASAAVDELGRQLWEQCAKAEHLNSFRTGKRPCRGRRQKAFRAPQHQRRVQRQVAPKDTGSMVT
jgi:hypothetical protein